MSTDAARTPTATGASGHGRRVDPVVALRSRLGASWWSRLIALGVTDGDLRAAVREGRVVADGAGTYWLAGVEPDALAAARARGRLTCCSAAARLGVELVRPSEQTHVAVPRARPTRDTGTRRVHRVDTPGDGPIVPIVTALATILRCLPTVEAVVAVDSAVRQRLVSVSALLHRARGPGSVEVRRRLGLVDGRSGSVIETVLRLALRQAGLSLDCQVRIPGVGRVDLVVDGWLVVEVDGFAFHSDRNQYRVDRARANALVAQGYVLVRVTWEDVMYRLDETVALIISVRDRGRL